MLEPTDQVIIVAGWGGGTDYMNQTHQTMLMSTVACPRDPGSFEWLWLAVIVPLAVLYCIIPLTSAWVTPLKRHLFRRNRLFWIGTAHTAHTAHTQHTTATERRMW